MTTLRSAGAKGLATALAAVLATSASAGERAPDQTGQGLMVNLKVDGALAIDGADVHRFDPEAAARFFTNAWDGAAPAVSCAGSACRGDVCGVPAAPPAPPPDPSRVTNPEGSAVADRSRCTFLDGGFLSITDRYTRSATARRSCVASGSRGGRARRSATYTFTYGYLVAPRDPSSAVAPFTVWRVDGASDRGLARVEVGAEIARQSVVVTRGRARYAFTLTDDGASRLQDLALTVDGRVVARPVSIVAYPVDFDFVANAGASGAAAYLVDGRARAILAADASADNDEGGADGSALALARIQPVGIGVGPGKSVVGLSGTIRGDDGGSARFEVSRTVVVLTPGCGDGRLLQLSSASPAGDAEEP